MRHEHDDEDTGGAYRSQDTNGAERECVGKASCSDEGGGGDGENDSKLFFGDFCELVGRKYLASYSHKECENTNHCLPDITCQKRIEFFCDFSHVDK